MNELNKFHIAKNSDDTFQDSRLLDIDTFNLSSAISGQHDLTTNEPASINHSAIELKYFSLSLARRQIIDLFLVKEPFFYSFKTA